MPEHPNHTATRAKHVCLTDDARAAVQAWADREGVSFSAAIETLARLGLQQDPRDAWGPALAIAVRSRSFMSLLSDASSTLRTRGTFEDVLGIVEAS